MNHLDKVTTLKNRYFAVRHGESKANVAGIIVSDPKIGTVDYGLTEIGKQQVYNHLSLHPFISEKSIVISSDFLRAQETASELISATDHPYFLTDIRLRERFFGSYDQKSIAHYFESWKDDLNNALNSEKGVESTDDVTTRMTSVIIDCETQCTEKDIYLVSHGDPLQILETAFFKAPSHSHRQRPKIENAEIREMILKI